MKFTQRAGSLITTTLTLLGVHISNLKFQAWDRINSVHITKTYGKFEISRKVFLIFPTIFSNKLS